MNSTHVIITLFLSLAIIAQVHQLSAQQNGRNPVFVHIDSKLGKVVHHRVLEQQTLYSISQHYGVDPAAIRRINPEIKRDARRLPAVVVVPITNDQVIYRLPLFKSKRDFVPVYYRAQKKDNLFRIARHYFDMPINLLTNRNDLRGNDIKKGQTLHIGWLSRTYRPLLVTEGSRADEDEEPESELARMFGDQPGVQDMSVENEVAFCNIEETTKGLFVLHRSAPERSIIEIHNPMFGTTAYAKVIGKLPTHLYAKEIDMVISKEVAEVLRAVDPKFFVRVRYPKKRSTVSR